MLKKMFLLTSIMTLLAASAMASQAYAQAVPSRDPATVQDGAYSVEPNHTRVLFSVSHLGFTTWYGEFTNVSGSLSLAPKSLKHTTLEIHIPTGTISTSNAKLDGELKSGDWFDAAKYPEILFTATKITQTGKNTAAVTGDLAFHGVTKPVTLKVKFNAAGINPLDHKYTVGFEVSGKIKRSDYGVKTYLPLIGDDVTLIISAAFEHN
jgi:polyisoprenoid-binding protein YceI